MDRDMGKIAEMMQKPVSDLEGDLVPFFNREFGAHGHIYLRLEPVPQPSYRDFGNLLDPRGLIRRIFNLFNHLRVNPVEEACKNRLARFPYDSKDGSGNQKADQRVCEGITQPDPHRTEKDG